MSDRERARRSATVGDAEGDRAQHRHDGGRRRESGPVDGAENEDGGEDDEDTVAGPIAIAVDMNDAEASDSTPAKDAAQS